MKMKMKMKHENAKSWEKMKYPLFISNPDTASERSIDRYIDRSIDGDPVIIQKKIKNIYELMLSFNQIL